MNTSSLKSDKKQVKFTSWDVVRRPLEDVVELATFKPDKGEYIKKTDDMFVIDWHDPETGRLIRSLHHETEFEEYIPPISLEWDWPTPEQEVDIKRAWLKRHNLVTKSRLVKDKKQYFFVYKGQKEFSLEEVGKAFTKWKLSDVIYKRLKIVAQLDQDRARIENGVGFNKNDSDFGHSLVKQFEQYDSWSHKQLVAAIRLQHKYRRQFQLLIGIRLPPLISFFGYNLEGSPITDKYLDTPVPVKHDEELEIHGEDLDKTFE